VIKGNLMIKKIALVPAFFLSFSSVSFAGETAATDSSISEGTNDLIELGFATSYFQVVNHG
jgi:hypothetical protein